MNEKNVKKYLADYSNLINEVDHNEISKAIKAIESAWISGNKIIGFGNGGSALNVQHFMNDWVKSIYMSKNIPFNGLSLVDNVGLLTAYSNDCSYEEIFLMQLKPILSDGDIVIAVSGSGNSPNVIRAVEFAKENNNIVISLTGFDGGSLFKLSDIKVHLPVNDMQMTEDFHLQFGHLVMKSLCHW
jgi:D-sedoheptulose 7-phosphate isomerase